MGAPEDVETTVQNMGAPRAKYRVCESMPVIFSILTFGAFLIFINIKPISAGERTADNYTAVFVVLFLKGLKA